VDDEAGAYQAACFLLERGHRDIVCLTFETDYSREERENIYGVGQRRLRGYQSAFRDFGLTWSNDFLIPTFASAAAGAEAFTRLWQQESRPTAVLAVADIIAIGVLQAAAAVGVDVPDEVAVIGFDDIPLAAWTTPPLTTVHQPILEKGEIAAQQLVALIAGETPSELKTLLPTNLVVRQSA
jgi:DNA-binding LacI/PurR family transcriptional regulator